MSKLTESLEREFEQQRAIENRLRPEMFPAFCEYYFTDENISYAMGACHKEWASKYFLAYKGEIETPEDILNKAKYRHILIEAPTGSAKSTYFGVFLVIWYLINNRQLRIMLGSHSLSKGKELLRAIKNNLESNPKLIEDFGIFKPSNPIKWTETEIYIEGARKAGAPSIQIVSVEGAAAGKRCDILIMDDALDDKNSMTEILRRKIKTWFDGMALSRLEPNGLVRMIGTDFGEFCLYQDIINKRNGQYSDFITAVYRSIDAKNIGPNGELWPEYWPYDKLMSEKNLRGTLAFERYMQNNPKAASELGIFKEKWLQYYPNLTDDLRNKLSLYMGVDLAISTKETADYFVILVVGIDPKTENIYLIDIYRKHVGFSEQVNQILTYQNKWNCLMIGIGNKAYQDAMPQHLTSFKTMPIKGIDESTPKAARLTKMSLYFERGKVFIKPTMTEFVEEYLTYDPDDKCKSPDMLDGLYFALECGLNSLNNRFVSTVAGENRKRSIWGL